ncbi:MAG TPA: LPS export ABC transporter permease LptG [Granulicella sp.]|jgi:LPS export ABC transporter permease LptG/LPS export ABC transporter permease LptF|nr:LPS export ABC transporter permease LptG [Granulicella sp.]
MRLLTRYILREVSSHALLGGVLFTFVLFMRDLSKILELVVRNSAGISDVIRIILYTLPNAFTVTIPMAILVGILLGLSRLATDSEITAMRASGMGALDFVRVVSIVSAVGLGLGLVNSMVLAPRAAAALLALQDALKSSQASFEVQPRVFYEDFRNYVLYVQDVRPAAGTALWQHVFLADLSQPGSPQITTAADAVVVSQTAEPDTNGVASGDAPSIHLHMMHGTQHQVAAGSPNQYDVSTFLTTDIPIASSVQDDTHVSRMDTPLHALSLQQVYRLSRAPAKSPGAQTARPYQIELNTRFSYPFACLVLMLVGVPLGITSKRGGRSSSFVLTIFLVVGYYLISSVGVGFAKSGKLSPFLGVWSANLIFTVAGAVLLQQMSRGGTGNGIFAPLGQALGQWLHSGLARLTRGRRETGEEGMETTPAETLARIRSTLRTRFPLLLDDYVMREFLTNFALVLAAFTALFLFFTFFELTGDIIRNRTPLVTVGEYLLNLIPYIVYAVTPLCSLVAVLITFGALNRSSELTAMKATGISLYRVVTPVLVVAALVAGTLFVFGESYLPDANRRQEALLAEIKHKPAQTFLRPDRRWISGQTGATGTPARIFYYQFFDPDRNVFAEITVFELDPNTFELKRRIFASEARWDEATNQWIFKNGWQRTFSGEAISRYEPFATSQFPEIREQPGYFKKEALQSEEMSYGELSHYITDLRQSGFDTMRLRVQLMRKIAAPLVTLVMAILAVPFALSMGKRGSLAGIGTAIGLAITYWVVEGVFAAMGNVNTLPPLLAAWSPDLLFGMAGAYLLLRTPT